MGVGLRVLKYLLRLILSQEKKDKSESPKILGRIEKIAIGKLVEKRGKTAERFHAKNLRIQSVSVHI